MTRRRSKRTFKVTEAFLQHFVEFCRAHPHLDATRFRLVGKTLGRSEKGQAKEVEGEL